MRSALIALVALLAAGPCLAQEPVGCDKFKWPLDHERAMLTGTDVPTAASGGSVTHPLPVVVSVALVPFADAKLPMPPERAPKSPASFAGFVQLAAPSQGGTYKVSLSSEGWVDVVQDGRTVKSAGFSGATGCDGIRKSVKFELAAQPFSVELSGIPVNAIRIAITGD
jgi:hypothetical protein